MTADVATLSRGNGKGKLRLLSRNSLDGRTRARKQFDAIACEIVSDLGGEANLTTVQKHLIEAYAGSAVMLGDINARALLGEPVDLFAYSQAVSTLTRVASRLGTKRVPRTIGPSLADIMREAQSEPAHD